MQPKLNPVQSQFSDYAKKLKLAAKKSVEEMLKRPCTFQEAIEDMRRLRAERNKKSSK